MTLSVLGETLLFLVAFLGFLSLYGLDHLAAGRRGQAGTFTVHLAVFAAYNALITYTLPTHFPTDPGFAILFIVAMGLHFVLTDRGLAEHHGDRFKRTGRPTLVAALGAGFLLAWVFAPTSTTVVSVLLAALGGFVLYNVFSDEIPDGRNVRFPVFALSTGTYALLLFSLTVIES